jgi:4-amino-4-deoxy-L-arabinose transferase-like glycosyltransferase
MALIGIASTYLLARRFVGTGATLMVTLMVLVFPGFARETASFMTDVPTYALVTLSLLLGTRWLQGDGTRVTLIASLLAGLAAVSIREFALAAPAAILVAAWARSRPDERVWLAGASGAVAAGTVSVLRIASSIPGHAGPATPDLQQVALVGSAFATLAAVLLPAAALAIGRRITILTPSQIILGSALGCLIVALPSGPLVGDLWMANGLGGDFLLGGTRDLVIGTRVWALSTQLASFAAVLFAALALRWGQSRLDQVSSFSTAVTAAIRIARSREAPLVLFLAAYALELAVVASMGSMFDRYLYPMVPAAGILLLRAPVQHADAGRSRAFAHAAFGWLGVSALVIAANSFAYDAARSRSGQAAVAMGYDARTVDAGLEWVGYHASGVERPGSNPSGLTWYEDDWPSFRPCAVVSNSPLDVSALTLIRVDRSAYLNYLFFGPEEPLYLYGAVGDGCPPIPAAAAGSTGS